MSDAPRDERNESEYRAWFAGNPLPMLIFDIETLRFLDVNQAAVEGYGYTREEFLRMTILDIRPQDYAAPVESMVRNMDDKMRNSGVWRHRRRDGTLIDVEVVSQPLPFAGRPARYVCPIDVTERRRAEAALRESELRFRQLTENINEAFFVVDPRTRKTLYLSPAFEQIWGRCRDEVYADTAVWEESIHPEDREVVVRTVERTADNGSFEREYRIRRPDGEERWIHSRGRVLRDETGAPYRLAGVSADITQRKAAEAEVARLNACLERRVVERTAALEAANLELEAFDYSVSHDLKSPLRHITDFSAALMEEYGQALDGPGRAYLDRLKRAGARLERMVSDLLGLSILTRGPVYRAAVDVSAVAESVVADLRAAEPGREVEVAIQPGLVAHADAGLLHIVLENLIGNAWKFTSRCAAARIEVCASLHGGKPHLHVRDNGAGFDMAFADKLFAPFRRLHKEDEFPGNGIGLATVQRIVRRHGGHIWPEAHPGRGASFSFTLAP